MKEEYKIYTEPSKEEIEIALKSEGKEEDRIRNLWNLYKTLDGDSKFRGIKREVELGIKYLFNIRLIAFGEIDFYYYNTKVKIKGCYKMNLIEYYKELEEREKKMIEGIRIILNSREEQGEEYDKEHDE